MELANKMSRKPDYGIDSPAIIAGQFFLSLLAFAVAAAFPRLFRLPMRWIGLLAGLYFLQGALSMLYYSRVGKLKLRNHLLGLIPWRGDERVLDVGCGRGLLLVAAAHRLTTGRAMGVDLWVPHAITGNGPEAVLENAAIEGVSERVEVQNADARQLPFNDASFDVVVSNFVLHEMQTEADREKMVREIARVLKPGGRLALADFIFTDQCVRVLKEAGVSNASRKRIGLWSFWLSAIFTLGLCQLYQVTGTRDVSASGT